MTGPLLQLRHVTKTFGSLVANDNVDLDVLPGRVHGLKNQQHRITIGCVVTLL